MSEAITKRVKSLRVVSTEAKNGGAPASDFKHSYAELLEIVRAQSKKVEMLQDKLEVVEANLQVRDEKHEMALAEAVEAARQEERSALDMSSKDIIDAGIESLTAGKVAFEAFLEKSEALSLNIVDQALSPLFTDPALIKATLVSAISKSINKLGQSSVLNVRLNAEDFGNPAELIEIAPDLESARNSFEIDPTLQSGESVFELLIGQYEISLPQHWASLQKFIKDAMRTAADEGDA